VNVLTRIALLFTCGSSRKATGELKKSFVYNTGGKNDQALCDIFLTLEKSSTPSYGIVVSYGFPL